VELVPPVLRRRILEAPVREGDHLLAYFNQPHLVTARLVAELEGARVPVVLYGDRQERRGLVELRRVDPDRFAEDLASCRALLCTGGHQLASEAIHLGKPMLVAPEASAEQRLNAREIERIGAGRAIAHDAIDAAAIRAFLDDGERYRTALRVAPRDGNARAVATLEAMAGALAHGRPPPRPTMARQTAA
jgi:uncharacterized protein (TIGR00661 family)